MGKWTKIWRFVPAMPDELQSFAELNQGSGAPCSRRCPALLLQDPDRYVEGSSG